jgi:hypothetical protein
MTDHATFCNKNTREETEPTSKLSELKLRAIDFMLQGRPLSEIATRIGCDRTTLYRWSREPAFIAEKNRREADLWGACQTRLRMLVGKSLGVLEKQVDAGNLKAAMAVLKLAEIKAGQPDGETDENRIIKCQAERMALHMWHSGPFAERNSFGGLYDNPYFTETAQVIYDELKREHGPEPSEAELLVSMATSREAEAKEHNRQMLARMAERQQKKQ